MLAARILKCGVNRVWVNPDYVDQVASAVQTDDIREFIDEGWIRAKPVKGTSRARARIRLEQKRKKVAPIREEINDEECHHRSCR